MTIIAWDGKTLAADKQCTTVGHATTVTKIFRVPGGLVGFTGGEGHAMALLAWFRAGRDPAKWPKKTYNESAATLFIDGTGVLCYSGNDGPFPARREDRFLACGSGRDYALAAMHLGFDARRAVEVASALDNCCGMGIDTLELE